MSDAKFFGSYQLLHSIGSGGAAEVFRARHVHPAYEQSFAIKILHKEQRRQGAVTKGFRREAYVLAMLRHPNIVQTIEAGIEAGDMFIAMEFIDGKDLRDVLERLDGQPLAQAVALHVVAEILRGLGYAHELIDDGVALSIIHRDVKPSNILLGFNGSVKLSDFGIVTLTDAAALGPPDRVMGTLGYIAPEALVGDTVDQRADLFAVGSILYELLTGVGPFDDAVTEVLLRNNTRAKMPHPQTANPRLSDDLSRILLKALDRKPHRRYQDAKEFLLDLQPHLPRTRGIGLAVSTYLRSLFVDDFVSRMRYATDKPNAPRRITFLGNQALATVLAKATAGHGVKLSRSSDSSALGASLIAASEANTPPDVLVVDVSHKGFSFDLLRSALAEMKRPPPIITTCDGLLPSFVSQSFELGAVDVVYGAPHAPRLLASIRNAMIAGIPQVTSPNSDAPWARVGLVTTDEELAQRLAPSLAADYAVERLSNSASALAQSQEQTFHAFVVDSEATEEGPSAFVDTLRGQPGFGLLPVLCLVDVSSAAVKLPNRCSARQRTDSVEVINAALNELRSAHHFGRLFTRLDCDFQVALHYQGRALDARCTNISRGGLMLETSHLPSKGVEVVLVFRLDGHDLQLQGHVVRAEPPSEDDGNQANYVSIAFMPTAAKTERVVIRYLARLEGAA